MYKLIQNGRIWLGDDRFCEALLVKDGRIAKTGTSREITDDAPSGTQKIDANGALVLPAFHDSHLHLMGIGRREGGIEATGAKSIDDIISRGKKLIALLKPPRGACIQGGGVNPDLFTEGEKRDLCREDVDRISTENPVILSRHCGHTIYCNSAALSMAGISETAPDVEGGTVERDKNGRPTGVFRENASGLVRRAMPEISFEEMKGNLRLAMKKAHSLGISSCGSNDTGGSNFSNVLKVYGETYDEFRKAGLPGLRVTLQCGISASDEMLDGVLDYGRIAIREDPLWGILLKTGAVKLFIDGTLGGSTAWMRQPYKDKPETCGFPVIEKTALNNFIMKASAKGRQVLVHAIGDAGIDAVIEAYEKVTSPGKNPARHGIIHCQITSIDLLERMARNKILALVQPVFLEDDRYILESRVGPELASTSYAWATMRRLGIPVSYGTDSPVCSPDPLMNIQWAVLRYGSGEDPGKVTGPNETVDIRSAVEAYTRDSVFANYDETFLGRIEPGCYADLAILDKNIFTAPAEEIGKTKVIRTICAGETVYQR